LGPLTWERALALVIMIAALGINAVFLVLLSGRGYRRDFNKNKRRSVPILTALITTDVILAALLIAVATRILAV